MSALPTHLEAAGLRAYEQMRAFEEVERQHRPVSYFSWTLLPLAAGALEWWLHHPEMALACLLVALFFPFLAAWKMQRLRVRHLENKRFLAELERNYGPNLPWLEVERHLAQLQKLQDELKEEKKPPGPEE